MVTSIVQWGNSQGVRLPKTILREVDLAENDRVDIKPYNGAIVIRKARLKEKKHCSTVERIARFYHDDPKAVEAAKKNIRQEIDWGKSEGEEAW